MSAIVACRAADSNPAVYLRALVWMSLLRVLRFLMPLPRLESLMRGRARGAARDQMREARLVRAVDRAAGFLRVDPQGNCLERSLTLYRMLGQAGAQPMLVVGFKRDAHAGLLGHAWLTVGGHPVGEGPTDEYATIARFGGPET